MVAPSATFIDKFLGAPPPAICGFLLHGPEPDAIAARAQVLARRLARRSDPPGDIVRLHDADMAAEPERVLTELSMGTLFGGRKVVWLTSLPAKIQTPLLEATARPIADAYLIIQAPGVKKTLRLVQAFETSAHLASILCRPDDFAGVAAAVRQQLRAGRQDIDEDALALVVTRADVSGSIASREAEKLSLYAGTAPRIGLADVEACLGDHQTAEAWQTIAAALAGDGRGTLLAFERMIAGDANVTPVLLSVSAALQRLHALRAAVDNGTSLSQAFRELRPPVFPKQQEALARQLHLWPQAALDAALRRVNETLKETRLRPLLAAELTLGLLLDLARESRPSHSL